MGSATPPKRLPKGPSGTDYWAPLFTPPSLRLWFWLAPALTALIGGLLRFIRLGQPNSLVFDETYYVKDAYSYLQSGYERNWADKANDLFNQGIFTSLESTAEYVVHPPVGKWMIAFGMWIFGSDSTFGWRFTAALVGTVSIFILALIAQKMFRSTLLGATAGLLFAVDGHAIVQSRTSLLDIFVMFFALLSFGAILMDRDDGRRRLAAKLVDARRGGWPGPGESAAVRAVVGDPLVAPCRRHHTRLVHRHQVVRPVLPGRVWSA